jgi:hypothetical protein
VNWLTPADPVCPVTKVPGVDLATLAMQRLRYDLLLDIFRHETDMTATTGFIHTEDADDDRL